MTKKQNPCHLYQKKLFDEQPNLDYIICEDCKLNANEVNVTYSHEFNCYICNVCLRERQNENEGDKIDDDWWQ